MTKEKANLIYNAYAELERAAEAFYAAAALMQSACPKTSNRLSTICEEINCVIIAVDDELDEVV